MKRIFFVSTENGCNNNCIGCADDNSDKPKNGRDIKEIFYDLEEGVKKGYKYLHLAGGELTIQDNLFEILEKANSLYEEIYFTSNGRMFSYLPFAKKMVKSGITSFNITLAGSNKEIHESWTNTPGSFEQTVKGIKNLRSLTENVCVNYLVWKKSFDKLTDVVKLLEKLNIKHIDLFNVVPLGRAKNIYSDLFVPLKDLLVLEEQLSCNNLLTNIEIEDFPRCIFSEEFFGKSNVHIFDTSGKIYTDEDGNLDNYSLFAAKHFDFCVNSNLTVKERLEEVRKKFEEYRIKIDTCKTCSKNEVCGGIFSDYLDMNGKDETEKEILFLRSKQGY